MAEEFQYDAAVEEEQEEGQGDEMEFTGPIDLDLSDVKTEPVAKGWHLVEVVEVKAGFSKQKHSPQLELTLEVVGDEDEDVGRKLFENCGLAGNRRYYTRKTLEALGITPAQFKTFGNVEEVEELLAGRQARAFVVHNKRSDGDGFYANISKMESATHKGPLVGSPFA